MDLFPRVTGNPLNQSLGGSDRLDSCPQIRDPVFKSQGGVEWFHRRMSEEWSKERGRMGLTTLGKSVLRITFTIGCGLAVFLNGGGKVRAHCCGGD